MQMINHLFFSFKKRNTNHNDVKCFSENMALPQSVIFETKYSHVKSFILFVDSLRLLIYPVINHA